MPDTKANQSKDEPKPNFFLGGLGWSLTDKDKRSLLSFIAIGVVLVELGVTLGAVCYAIINAQKLADGTVKFAFPWIGYVLTLVLAPVVIMLIVQLMGLGLSRIFAGEAKLDEEQIKHLPERLRRLILLARGLPTVILFLGIVLLGVLLYYVDSVIGVLVKIGDHVETIVPWVMAGLVLAWCVSYLARMYFMYKTRRMHEEFAFRREVLERTGIVLVDGQKSLPAGPEGREQRAIAGPVIEVLPGGDGSPEKKDT